MGKSTKTALLVEGCPDERIFKRVIAAAEKASPGRRVEAGLEVVIAFSESDPAAARTALSALRADHGALRQLEACLPADADRATLSLGAAIRVALAELESPQPDLRARAPEMTRWLIGEW